MEVESERSSAKYLDVAYPRVFQLYPDPFLYTVGLRRVFGRGVVRIPQILGHQEEAWKQVNEAGLSTDGVLRS